MAVKSYSLKTQGGVYCSAHTQVKEMASIGQGKTYSDTVLVDTALMEMVEKLFSTLKCKKYIISSGYRTPAHDKAVEGNGSGYHTRGKAVDACFYDQSGKIIPAQIVCCVAEDLGFGGIANISKAYRYVHLDVRTGSRYLGDEIKGTNTVTESFYTYFGKTKSDVKKYTGTSVQYYPKYCGSSTKIDEVLKTIGVPSAYIGSWAKRRTVAAKNGITAYVGTAAQNLTLVKLAKQGELRK